MELLADKTKEAAAAKGSGCHAGCFCCRRAASAPAGRVAELGVVRRLSTSSVNRIVQTACLGILTLYALRRPLLAAGSDVPEIRPGITLRDARERLNAAGAAPQAMPPGFDDFHGVWKLADGRLIVLGVTPKIKPGKKQTASPFAPTMPVTALYLWESLPGNRVRLLPLDSLQLPTRSNTAATPQ